MTTKRKAKKAVMSPITRRIENCRIVDFNIVPCKTVPGVLMVRMLLNGTLADRRAVNQSWQTAVELVYSSDKPNGMAQDVNGLVAYAGASSIADMRGKYLRVEILEGGVYRNSPNMPHIANIKHILEPWTFEPTTGLRIVQKIL